MRGLSFRRIQKLDRLEVFEQVSLNQNSLNSGLLIIITFATNELGSEGSVSAGDRPIFPLLRPLLHLWVRL